MDHGVVEELYESHHSQSSKVILSIVLQPSVHCNRNQRAIYIKTYLARTSEWREVTLAPIRCACTGTTSGLGGCFYGAMGTLTMVMVYPYSAQASEFAGTW